MKFIEKYDNIIMMKNKDFREGHRRRLREKVIIGGFDTLNDYEIVELLLTLGTPRKDCKEAAKIVIKNFGSLNDILSTDEEQLLKIEGIGKHNIFGIKLAKEILKSFHKRSITNKKKITDAKDVVNYLRSSMSYEKREIFKTIFLDVKNNIIKIEDLFKGTINESPVYPREVIKKVFLYNATSIIIAHNHPSGDVTPSKGDILVTEKLKDICETMNISMLDHIIISIDDYYSFAEEGIL